MTAFLFSNGNVFDGSTPHLLEGYDVLVENDRIREVSDHRINVADAVRFDIRGLTLMPGLIDAHVHILPSIDLADMSVMPPSLLMGHAVPLLRDMLGRGFTTIRDAGGADWGMAAAVDMGLIDGPRMLVAGKALSQTGGHGDWRHGNAPAPPCGCFVVSRLADGVPEVRKAAREELRKGAQQIKVMLSGGLASYHGRMNYLQYSKEELSAIVDEATRKGTYVMAHCYSAESIRHALDCGVRSIEHGIFIDQGSAELAAERGAFVVPTLANFEASNRLGPLNEMFRSRIPALLAASGPMLEICRNAGVQMGFGTDVIGKYQKLQSYEFSIRAEVLPPAEILFSATSVNARLLERQEDLGVVAERALADLLVVDGDPVRNLQLLQDEGRHLKAIMKAGRLFKCDLSSG